MYNGASYHSEANKMCPLREIAGINAGIIQIHVPFSMANVSQYKARLKWFSKSPEIFIYEFKVLTATFDLTWADAIFSVYCSTEKKLEIWTMAQNYADDIHVWEPNKSVGTAVVPNTDLELSNQE
jgi:hypothetical protein